MGRNCDRPLIGPLPWTRTTADFAAADRKWGATLRGTKRWRWCRGKQPAAAPRPLVRFNVTHVIFQTFNMDALSAGWRFFQRRRILTPVPEEIHSLQIVVLTSKDFRVARQVRYLVGYGLG